MTVGLGDVVEPGRSIFACFFRRVEGVVKARKIPPTLACGVRVSSGEHEAGRQVAIPVQFLRAVLRLQESFGQGVRSGAEERLPGRGGRNWWS